MRALAAVAVLTVSFVALPASAQQPTPVPVPAFQIDRLELDSSATGSLLNGSGQTLPESTFRLFAALEYQRDPLVAKWSGHPTMSIVGDRFGLVVGGAWSVIDRLQLMAQLPAVLYQQGDDASSYGYSAPSKGGLGMPALGARYQLLRTDTHVPLDLAGEVLFALPIGSNAALANDPGFGFTPRLSAGLDVKWLRFSADVGIQVRPTAKLADSTLGTQFDWGLAVGTHGSGLRGELAIRSAIGFTPVPATADLLAGLRYPLGPFELFLVGGPGLGTAPGTPAFRLVFGAAYAHQPAPAAPPPPKPVAAPPPPPKPVCVAGQPHDPKLCPDLDLDNDGIPNRLDKCPAVPEDKDGFEDEDGCPDPDNDHDGVPDGADKCPTEAGPADRAGCPVHDADGEGVEDERDECPHEAGLPELRGCPAKDTDGDGVPDHLDNCPHDKGPASNQGCPERQKQLVVITREKLVIKDKVYFATGKSTIERRSFLLLDQIANVLKEHPDIKGVRIEGHTDDTGSAELNRKLSQSRAGAVRDYLLKKGIPEARLQAQGFGPDRPAADNKTPAGREANRRVEFVIIDEERSTP